MKDSVSLNSVKISNDVVSPKVCVNMNSNDYQNINIFTSRLALRYKVSDLSETSLWE